MAFASFIKSDVLHAHTYQSPALTLFLLRTHAFADGALHKSAERESFTSVTYGHARTCSLDDSRSTLEIGESREEERERKERDSATPWTCENRRSAFNGHFDARHHHWSWHELLWEECRKLQVVIRRNMEYCWQEKAIFQNILFALTTRCIKDFQVFFYEFW